MAKRKKRMRLDPKKIKNSKENWEKVVDERIEKAAVDNARMVLVRVNRATKGTNGAYWFLPVVKALLHQHDFYLRNGHGTPPSEGQPMVKVDLGGLLQIAMMIKTGSTSLFPSGYTEHNEARMQSTAVITRSLRQITKNDKVTLHDIRANTPPWSIEELRSADKEKVKAYVSDLLEWALLSKTIEDTNSNQFYIDATGTPRTM